MKTIPTTIGLVTLASLLLLAACGPVPAATSVPELPTPTLVPSPHLLLTPTPAPADTPAPPTATPTSIPPTPTPIPTATTPPPEHRLGVRVVDGLGQFYDKATGERFVPRGMNYARLDHTVGGGPWHSTFDPALYDTARIDEAFARMQEDGYNVVRVFIDCCSPPGQQVGNRAGGLNSAYMAKVVDFLQRAKTHEIFVLLSVDLTPGEGGYNDPLWPAETSMIQGENIRYLTAGGLQAKRAYMIDFVQGLLDLHAPLEAVFAYDLTNEVNLDSSAPPLSLSSGLVTTVNGKTYDMAKQDEKDNMVNDNLIYWIGQLRASVRELDPTALVEVSFFVPQAPVPMRVGDNRFILTEAAITRSEADFIDLHPYPDGGLTLAQYAQNFGIGLEVQKPVILGEFGGSTASYGSAESAAQALRDWQIDSCRYGFDGWLLWTWDTEAQWGFWNALSEGGAIERALAPVNRPDPCR